MIREDDLLASAIGSKISSDKDLMDIVTGYKKPPKQMIKDGKRTATNASLRSMKRRMSELASERKDGKATSCTS